MVKEGGNPEWVVEQRVDEYMSWGLRTSCHSRGQSYFPVESLFSESVATTLKVL